MLINQWLPAAHRGDAVGDSARRVRDLLREMGHQAGIFALTIDDDMRDEVRPFDDPAARCGDVTIYHFAVPSPMSQAFGGLAGRRIVQYHNVTPARFFARYDPGIFRITAIARGELAALTAVTDLALGDSDYNRRELVELGFPRTGVLPIAVNTRRLTEAARVPALDAILGDGLTNFLFVGRIVPNKCVEDIVRLAEHFKRYIDAAYRFIFVGRTDAVPLYYAMIRGLIARFQMSAERFLFAGTVSDAELAAYYRHASVYVSMSEHEGFCVPLIEAMAMDVPVMAYASTAVPETLGGAGVVFAPKNMEHAAELLGQLAFDPLVRQRVIAGQRERLKAFSEDRLRERVREIVGD